MGRCSFVPVLLILYFTIVSVVSGNEDTEKKKDSTSPIDFLAGLGNPEAKVALEAVEQLKKLLHTSSSSHISSREKTSGFEFLNIKANAQSSRGLPKFLLTKGIRTSLKPFASVDADMKKIVDKFEEYVEHGVEEHQDQFFSIISNKGDGETHAIFLYFKLREDNKYDFKKLLFSGSFRLAADLVIARETKKRLFSSSSRDVIRYLPRRGIQTKDVEDLMSIIIPKIAQVMNEFIPSSVCQK